MKVPVALQLVGGTILFFSGLVRSTDCVSVALTAIPSCAQPCYLENAPSIGCDGLDFACQCGKQAAMFAAIEDCVAIKCPESEFENVIDGSAEVCACAAPGGGTGSGSVTVSGTVQTIQTAQTVQTVQTAIPSNTASRTAVSAPTQEGGSRDGPVKSTPTHFSSSATVSGAERHAALGLGFVASAAGAALALMLL